MEYGTNNEYMSNKISVITVVYNDVKNIRQTMESFFSQTWEDKEYIVVDGGSTDGTADIIKEYADRLAWWCTEKDKGIYDAMNKGILHANGKWINILNCGDAYCANDSLRRMIECSKDINSTDVIYGNAIAITENEDKHMEAGNDISKLEYSAIYRHGCSLVRTSTHLKYMFALDKKKLIGFALDYDMIYRMYHSGCKFEKVDVDVQTYDVEGASNNIYKSIKYNYRITTQYGWSLQKFIFFVKALCAVYIKQSYLFRLVRDFIFEFLLNNMLPCVCSWKIRRLCLKLMGISIGKDTFISKDVYFMTPRMFKIGNDSDINRGCLLDARGGISIGNSVSISHNVSIVTGGHHLNSPTFAGKYMPIEIGDYAWLGIGCTILQGVKIGKGAVVCAGAVVTSDVEPYAVVAGTPAKKIKERTHDLSYKCKWNILFT